MKKSLLLIALLTAIFVNAQDTIRGIMKPAKKYSWSILYKLNGLNQKYISDAKIRDGQFTHVISKKNASGMYRIMYDTKENKFIDFIYNNESIEFEFHPDFPAKLVKYTKSTENMLLEKYIDNINPVYEELDSLQLAYFQTKDACKLKKTAKKFESTYKKSKKIQTHFENQAVGKLALSFIKSHQIYYPKKILKNANEYMKSYETHYFDYIDFNDEHLINSSVLINSVVDFVMHTNTSKDPKIALKLRKDAIDIVMSKISNIKVKTGIIKSLLYSFSSNENLALTNYLFKNYYEKLYLTNDFEFKTIIFDKLKTTIGNYARDIVWTEKGEEKKLYDLKEKDIDYYLIVFWSSTCGHCLKEMPLLQKYIETQPNVKVVAIGLENENSKLTWKEETYYYEDFIHILALGKYQVNYVIDYGVENTPNFFLLDRNKKIIDKPYNVKAIKEFFKKHLVKQKKQD